MALPYMYPILDCKCYSEGLKQILLSRVSSESQMKKNISIAAVIVALCLPVLAKAQALSGAYIGADVGANFANDLESAGSTTRITSDAGPAEILNVGWGFGNGLRTELEGSYRSNDLSDIETRRNQSAASAA